MMPLPPFELHTPLSIEAVLELLERHGEHAAIIAGGTDVVPALKLGLMTPRHVVSLRKVDALRGVTRSDDYLSIGAMTPLDQVALLHQEAPALAEAAGSVGGPHHRHAGTLGGNLCLDTRCRYYNQGEFWREALGHCLKKDGTVCHVVQGGHNCVAAASNDTACAAIALESTLELIGPRGRRLVPAADFWRTDGIRNTSLEPGEMVMSLRVPIRAGRRSAYEKLRRRASIDFPLLCIAVRADMEADVVTDLVVVLSALAAKPRFVARTTEVARGKTLGAVADAIGDLARKGAHPLSNLDGDLAWRREMAGVLTKRAIERLARL